MGSRRLSLLLLPQQSCEAVIAICILRWSYDGNAKEEVKKFHER